MALYALRASRTLAGRGLLAQRPVVASSAFGCQRIGDPCPAFHPRSLPLRVQSRNYSLPSWLSGMWPFGESTPASPEPAETAPVDPEPEPLEVVTGFTSEGAYTPVNADMTDFTAAARWANDALTPNLDAFGLGSYWTLPGWAEHLFVYMTNNLHMSVLASLFGLVLLFRLPSIPFYIKARRNQKESMEVFDRLRELRRDMSYYESIQDLGKVGLIKLELKQLSKKSWSHKIPLLMQMPIAFVFLAIRTMSSADFSLLANGQFLWVPTLTSADPYYLLPPMFSGLMLTLILTKSEMGADAVMKSANRLLIYGGVCASGIFMAFMPAASVLVLIMNGSITLTMALVLKIPPVRTMLKLPDPALSPSTTGSQNVKNLRKQLSSGVSALPLFTDIKNEWANSQLKGDYKISEADKMKEFKRQIKLASDGKLRYQ